MMQQTKTWVVLYVLGIALLVFSLCRSEEASKLPASLSQRGGDSSVNSSAGRFNP